MLFQFVVASAAAILGRFLFFARREHPILGLQSSHHVEQSHVPLTEDFESLPTEFFRQFDKGPVCITDEPCADRLRSALNASLSGLPPYFLHELLHTKIVLDRMSFQVPMDRDTVLDLEDKGKASSVRSAWSVLYNRGLGTYSVCVAVSGLEYRVAEVVAGFETSQDEVIIGWQPCQCGWVMCESCPIKSTIEKKTPLFKRHVLTFGQQEQLADHIEIKLEKRLLSYPAQPMLSYAEHGVHKMISYIAS